MDCDSYLGSGLGSGRFRLSTNLFAAALISLAASTNLASAADLLPPPAAPSPVLPAATDPVTNYFLHWYDRVHEAQATQPHWITPLVTVTPRLEEEIRYDQYWDQLGNGAQISNFSNGKGLELIPTTTNEVLLNIPAYQERTIVKPAKGTADWNFLTVKQRLLSANEENGNYILSAFLGFTAPTGAPAFTNRAWIVTPTIAGGFGVGDFDVQATFGVQIPTAESSIIGTAFATNVAFQYHIFQYFWPEIEINDTAWSGGLRNGLNQVFLTPGVILGRFPLGAPGVNAIFGVGYQVALNPSPAILSPALTPIYNHAWLLSGRVTF